MKSFSQFYTDLILEKKKKNEKDEKEFDLDDMDFEEDTSSLDDYR